MRKVISTALFGESAGRVPDKTHYGGEWYGAYLGSFVRAALNIFPRSEGWEVHIYADIQTATSNVLLGRLAERGLIGLGVASGPVIHTRSMLWRLIPVFDPEVDYVFCRDLDALPMPRDRACCEAFIRSKCVTHVVHDNVQHGGVPGGLCGFWAPELRRATGWNSIDDVYAAAGESDKTWARHGTDQLVLARLLVRPGGPRLLEHRFAGWTRGKPTKMDHRRAGRYPCGGLSQLVPDDGISSLSTALTAQADRLADFMGAAGYDHRAASAFWDEHGDPEVRREVEACEYLTADEILAACPEEKS